MNLNVKFKTYNTYSINIVYMFYFKNNNTIEIILILQFKT